MDKSVKNKIWQMLFFFNLFVLWSCTPQKQEIKLKLVNKSKQTIKSYAFKSGSDEEYICGKNLRAGDSIQQVVIFDPTLENHLEVWKALILYEIDNRHYFKSVGISETDGWNSFFDDTTVVIENEGVYYWLYEFEDTGFNLVRIPSDGLFTKNEHLRINKISDCNYEFLSKSAR